MRRYGLREAAAIGALAAGALAYGADGLDLPRFLPFAGELDEIRAVGAPDPPSERRNLLDDAVVELDGKVAKKGDRLLHAEGPLWHSAGVPARPLLNGE